MALDTFSKAIHCQFANIKSSEEQECLIFARYRQRNAGSRNKNKISIKKCMLF